LTGGGRLATLGPSEGIGMGEIDDRTVAGLKATPGGSDGGTYLSVFHRPDGAWRWSIDMWNSDAG
jgi:hypothetical protein